LSESLLLPGAEDISSVQYCFRSIIP